LMVAISISNLLLLMLLMLMKCIKLLNYTGKRALSALSIVCQWAVEVKDMILQSSRWPNFAWRKGGVSRPDYTSTYSEMHGAHDDGTASRHDEDYEVKDKTGLEQRIREAGY